MMHSRKFKRTDVLDSKLIRAKGTGETLEQIYARLDPKPTYLINGGYFTMSDGWTLAAMKVDGKVIREVSATPYGYVLCGKGSIIKIHTMGKKSFLDIAESYDWAIEVPLVLPLIRGVPDATKVEPRTAFGFDNGSDEYEITVTDGRPYGLTIKQMGDQMDSSSAVNLDGGGSSKVLYNGKSINDQEENRPIANAIAIWVKEELEGLIKVDMISGEHITNPKIEPKGLTVHTTANRNKGATAMMHDRYYDNNSDRVSVTWTVDNIHAVQSLDEYRAAWHAGNRDYNLCYIGMEICENNVSDGKLDIETYNNAVLLAADILNRHKWGTEKMIRHCDVPGREWKNCPNKDLIHWESFKADVQSRLIEVVEPKPEKSNTFYRVQIGYFGVKENAERLAKELENRGYQTIIKEEGGK